MVQTLVLLATIGATIRRDIAAYARITSDVVIEKIQKPLGGGVLLEK